MAYEFHYTPTGTGVISGKEVLEQTEDAINDLGNTAISGVQEALDKAEQALTNSENAVDDAQTALNTANNAKGVAIQAQTDVGNLSGTVTNIGNRVTTAEGNITNLQGRMTTAEGNITNLQGRMTTAETNIGNLQTAVSTAQATANSAQQTATTARQQSYVVRYASVAVSDNSTVPYTDLNNTDNIKANDLLLDTNGKLYQISSVDTSTETVSVTTPLTQLAVDSSVIHNTGNETKNGELTLSSTLKSSDIVPLANLTYSLGTPDYKYNNVYAYMYNSIGRYLGNESNSNQRTNITLYANRDTQNQSCAYITRFRQNRSQGALQPTDLQKIGFDVLENEVRTNNVFDIQCTDWLNNVPQKVNLVSSVPSYSYGRSSNKALINDLNPGALSLPDLNNGIDISGYITLDTSSNTYTPSVDGWICIKGVSSGTAAIYVKSTNGFYASANSIADINSTTRFTNLSFPVIKNEQYTVVLKSVNTSISAKFYPNLGNV